MSYTISVIIPFYNNWQLTHSRLMELHSHVEHPLEIIAVNDGSTDITIDVAMSWWTSVVINHKIVYVRNKENRGFGYSMNKGVKVSSGEFIILFSNDVIIKGDFVKELLELQKRYSEKKAIFGGELYLHDTGWNVMYINGKPKLFPYLAGWLLAMERAAWDDIGGFDSLYGKFDYEDVDFSTMALHREYSIVPLNSKYLHHLSGQTVGRYFEDREKITRKNRKKFIHKWSKLLDD